MKTISVINQKGGVGKTTSTYNIATLLANKGYRVLMIDNDGQASLTLACGYNPIDLELTMSDVYVNNTNIIDCILETDIDYLDLAPSTIKLTMAETSLINTFARETVIKSKLLEIKDEYDFILIDNPPHLGLLTINSLVASDYVLIPCATNSLATYALEDLFNTIEGIKKINHDIQVLGIIATMFDKRANIDKQELQYMKDKYSVVGTIKSSVDGSKGLSKGLPTVTVLPKSDVSMQYIECTENILKLMEEANNA